MKTHYTVIVLDSSSSMNSLRDEALDACNEQIRDIRKAVEGEDDLQSRVGLVKFGSTVEKSDVWNTPISGVRNIKRGDYVPRGMTAMLDGVGVAITKLQELPDIEDEDTTVLINIISDGHENNSKQYSYGAIAELIQNLQSTGRWTFTYSGANQNLAEISERMSIPVGNTQAWEASSEGMKMSTRGRSMSYDTYFGDLKKSRAKGEKKFQASNFYSGNSKS